MQYARTWMKARLQQCSFGLRGLGGGLLQKDTAIITTDPRMFVAMSRRCDHKHKHETVQGYNTKHSENYSPEMGAAIAKVVAAGALRARAAGPRCAKRPAAALPDAPAKKASKAAVGGAVVPSAGRAVGPSAQVPTTPRFWATRRKDRAPLWMVRAKTDGKERQIVQFTRSQLGSRNGHDVATVFMRLLVKYYERVRRLPEKSEQRALKAEALA
ncbi:MAG: hypothetical protein GY772_02800 [bacterium]|nr:hypothetical protein [bacterium]